MTREEKEQLIADILVRDRLTGASVPIYQHIPQLEPYLKTRGLHGVRDCASRFEFYSLIEEQIKGKTVLDLGCDNGMVMYEFFKRGAKLTVGIQSPQVGDEAERVARLIGNNRSRFYGIDLKTATAEDIRARIGIEQFDIVLYLAMDSFFGHLPE